MIDYEPKRISVKELFKHDNTFSIPRYQRSYAWKTDNIDDFYEDFVKTSEAHMNFFGTFVFDASRPQNYEVIDGQQRLLTLTIFFAALRDILNEDIATQSAYKLAQSIEEAYIRADDDLSIDDTSIYRIKAAKNVDEFFLQFIQMGGPERRKSSKPTNPSQKNIKAVYDYLRSLVEDDKIGGDKLTQDQKVAIIRDTANQVGRVTAIKIEIYNDQIAYSIFESHNAKGEDLLISDLIKNYYYSKLSGPEDGREARIDEWDAIVDRLRDQASIKIDNFLHYYAQSFDGRFLKSQLYKRIKSEINDDVQVFTKQFKAQSNLFIELKDASVSGVNDSLRINQSLERITKFNVDQVYIFLLSLFRNQDKIHPTFIKKIVLNVEKHTFLYNVIGKKQGNVMEKIYGSLSYDLEHKLEPKSGDKLLASSGGFYSDFTKKLKATIPTQEQFTVAFKELDYTSPKQKRTMKDYIFPVIEERLTNSGMTFGVNISLDHIAAKNGKVHVGNMHKIGNLVPIDADSNSRLGNKPLADKLDIYREYRNRNIDLLLAFIDENGTDITDELIDRRAEQMAELAYTKVWKLD